MLKKVLLSGVLGGIVLILSAGVANIVFRFRSYIDMRTIPDESRVYEALKQSITTPGAYMFNPTVTAGQYPGQDPVFLVRYSGIGHESAAVEMFLGFGLAVIAAMIAAAMLWLASNRLPTYWRRLLFFALVGLLFAVFGDLASVGILGYPFPSALLLAGHHLLSWTLAGLVMAWLMRPPGQIRPEVSPT